MSHGPSATGAAPFEVQSAEQPRGRLKVFIGMAAGVGKTFRMLLEGQAELEAGRDVVIGLLETHGRDETARIAEGLPRVPRRRVSYREAVLEEMDLPTIVRRAPELCLIDELAHTNAPGVEHGKRYDDVEEVLAAKRLTTELVGSREESLAADAPRAVGERLLALVEPYPGAQRLVRRAWRSAQRLGADLDLLWVRAPGQCLSDDQERSLAALHQLASVLGAKMLEEESDDLAAAIVDVAAQRGVTYILVGRSRPARGLARLRVPLPQQLTQRLPGVDVRIVSDRPLRQSQEKS